MRNSEADAIRWLRQAENDLDFARLALREGFYSQACFMSQQVAEKALKAVSYHRGDRFAVGHSLADLVRDLSESYPQLAELIEAAGLLDQYYIPTRYPDALPGGSPFEAYRQRQAEHAVEDAGRFVDASKGIVEA